MAFEIPYPCQSFEAHRGHPHTALVFNGTDEHGEPTYRPEPGMWCAGYVPPAVGIEHPADIVMNDVTGQTMVELATGIKANA